MNLDLTILVYLLLGVLIGVASSHLLNRVHLIPQIDRKLRKQRKQVERTSTRLTSAVGTAVTAFSRQVRFVDSKCDDAVDKCVEQYQATQTQTVAHISRIVSALAPRKDENGTVEPHSQRYRVSLEKMRQRAEDRTIEELQQKAVKPKGASAEQ